ncbi:MAG TPA: kelch repeat-containing protein [Thermoanaerobaculia bacterium]|nr:kelch repeat-containing protein [Thermoanaerobaculia bacterium]
MRHTALSLVLLIASNVAFAGSITRVGTLAVPRDQVSATLLSDGRVLVVGGNSAERRLEVFDPRTGTSTLVNEMTELPLIGPTTTRLRDGRLLILGGGYQTDGRKSFGIYGNQASEAYDDGAAKLTAAGRMNDLRKDHVATLLADGGVLITGGEMVNIGGFHVWRTVHASAEIFDPATNTFRVIASMHEARMNHTATLLRDGRVLIAGGSTLEIFDPQWETFTPLESGQTRREAHSATLLTNGTVLLVTGTAVEIFDPVTNQVAPAGEIGYRGYHTATRLRNGNVLLAGGAADAIVYDPAKHEIVEALPLPTESRVAAVLTENGSVLVIGGTEVLRYRPSLTPRRRAVRP